MPVLVTCLIAYLSIATFVMFLVWAFLIKAPLAFTTTLYWVATSAVGASLILGPGFARGSFPRLRQKLTVFVALGLVLLAGIFLFVAFGINDL